MQINLLSTYMNIACCHANYFHLKYHYKSLLQTSSTHCSPGTRVRYQPLGNSVVPPTPCPLPQAYTNSLKPQISPFLYVDDITAAGAEDTAAIIDALAPRSKNLYKNKRFVLCIATIKYSRKLNKQNAIILLS